MKVRSTQVLALAGIFGLGAVLSACSPPNENPSAMKVATATEFARAGSSNATQMSKTPGFIDCVGSPEWEPKTLALTCSDDSDRLIEIEWDEWTKSSATGTATRERSSAPDEDSTVRLSGPIQGTHGMIFTQVTVDGSTIFF